MFNIIKDIIIIVIILEEEIGEAGEIQVEEIGELKENGEAGKFEEILMEEALEGLKQEEIDIIIEIYFKMVEDVGEYIKEEIK